MNLRAILVSCALALVFACDKPQSPGTPQSSGAAPSGSANLSKLMKDRNLSEADVTAALKTYTPSGRRTSTCSSPPGGTRVSCW